MASPRDPAAPRVAALVVSYNGGEVLLESLESLSALDYPSFDLVVLDNASTDGTAAAVGERFPEVEVVSVEVNQGSSGGYSLAMDWALRRPYDYLLLLNNDIEVRPDLLTRLVEAAEAYPGAGVVGPKCYFYGRRDHLWSAGGDLRFRESVTAERGYKELDRGQYETTEEVGYINGCAMLVRRTAALEVGLFDPHYFMFVDDADYCRRLKDRGWSCLYAARAVLYHRVAYTGGGYAPARNRRLGRATAIFVRRYARPLQWLIFLAATATAFPLAWLRELPRRNQAAATAKIRGVLEGLREPLPAPPKAPEEARKVLPSKASVPSVAGG